MNSPNSPELRSVPTLWNPDAAGCWSLLFSPAFGAFLHARNAQALGRMEEASANYKWFYGYITYFVTITLLLLIFPIIPGGIIGWVGISLLVTWYLSLGKKQAKFVKETYGSNYKRKSWTKPLVVGFGCTIIFFVIPIAIEIFLMIGQAISSHAKS